MAVDRHAWVLGNQELDEIAERSALLWCAGVLWCSAVSCAAADIADAYAVCVLPYGVRADLLDGSAAVYTAVAIDYIVVADTLPASLLVPVINIGHSEVAALGCRAAVYDYLVDLSHN